MATDIYDFSTGEWRSGSSIPTARAGVVTVAYDGHIIVAGGEINTSAVALNSVEAYDVANDSWQALPGMTSGRHGSGGGIVEDQFLMLSGAPTIGGASELPGGEQLALPDIVPDVVEPEVVDPEIVEPEVVDPVFVNPELIDQEVVDPEVVSSEPTRRSGGGSGLLMLIGLMGVGVFRKIIR